MDAKYLLNILHFTKVICGMVQMLIRRNNTFMNKMPLSPLAVIFDKLDDTL